MALGKLLDLQDLAGDAGLTADQCLPVFDRTAVPLTKGEETSRQNNDQEYKISHYTFFYKGLHGIYGVAVNIRLGISPFEGSLAGSARRGWYSIDKLL